MPYTLPPDVEWVQSYKAVPQATGFLDLPRELRDLIYQYAFGIEGAIFIYSTDAYHVRRNAKAVIVRHKGLGPQSPLAISKSVPISLFRTCKQLHAESLPFLYSRNLFRLYASNTDFAPRYRGYVRNVVFSTDSMIHKQVFDRNVETVGYAWRRRFWPDVLQKSKRLLTTYPNLQTLTFAIKSSKPGETWRPAFMAAENRTRKQRVAVAAAWMRPWCPFANDLEEEKLRRCLLLEIVPGSPGPGSRGEGKDEEEDEYRGSRFEPEEEWDCGEFAEAWKLCVGWDEMHGKGKGKEMEARVRVVEAANP
ncbi:uncharacterized protein EI97DRAFT_35704 [Westerdykella ornata]|uniref:DUF7730 domain-containing protein n=1 Tax=Westerdykella ornata TaxID=318751 RepID=A0A6A6JJB7_WESOR|nr:uncharacterized protein EI97DRAFT_35704 [Westerdykella ornata]KAF2276335.1 hypothetical protein EI97DRAFT_35704 [Westerdykella ornata]